MSEPILLVDDDPDCATAVALALGPRYTLLVEETRAGALGFLRARAGEIRGVIVDLNLTEGTDNFGRDILERLSELSIPCAVFSSSVSDDEVIREQQANRFRVEFGVIDTIGKSDARGGAASLKELRSCVARMCGLSLEVERGKSIRSVEECHERCLKGAESTLNVRRSKALEVGRVSGKEAADRLCNEADRIFARQREDLLSVRNSAVSALSEAVNVEAITRLRDGAMSKMEAKV